MSPFATSTPRARSSKAVGKPLLASTKADAQPLPMEPTREEALRPKPSPTEPLRIELLPLAALTPWAKNARTHSRRQVRQIADSIEAFGFTNPVLVNASDTILAGHGRVEAARLLG